jgi:hypothetical protein
VAKTSRAPKRSKIERATGVVKAQGRKAVRDLEAHRKREARRSMRPMMMMTSREIHDLIDGETRRHLNMTEAQFRMAVKHGAALPNTPSVAQLRLITGADRR